MFIEIFQSIPHYWYNKHIGEVFEVIESGDPTEWAVLDNPNLHILKSDCREIITLGRLSA